jgi:DNA-binding NarL/FixJ family response regulator
MEFYATRLPSLTSQWNHILFREGLRRLLASEPDFETVAECGTPTEALEVLSRSVVDVILLDFDLENDTGTRFLSSVTRVGYRGRILMVTAGMSPVAISVARKLGISGIFLKHNPPASLIEATRTVANDGSGWTQRWQLRGSATAPMRTAIPNSFRHGSRTSSGAFVKALAIKRWRTV